MLKKTKCAPPARRCGAQRPARRVRAPVTAIAVAQQDGTFVARHGLLAGFDSLVWVIVGLNGCGGLLVAATTHGRLRRQEGFAAALAILSGTLLSVPIIAPLHRRRTRPSVIDAPTGRAALR